jgi:beta-mannosidase
MRTVHDLSTLTWRLAGWTPYLWQFEQVSTLDQARDAQVICAAKVPGSVQHALRAAGILPDWNIGLQAREGEWVENRQWMYETVLPDGWLKPGQMHRLRCLGLDYSGSVWLNGKHVGDFRGTHIPHVFDLTPHLAAQGNVLRIVFDPPPRWLGQFGYTSRMREWKVRFNYTWDWQPRLVQIGIWDAIMLEVGDGQEIAEFRCVADADLGAAPSGQEGGSSGAGVLKAWGKVVAGSDAVVQITLAQGEAVVREERVSVGEFNAQGITWRDLPVALWWPNLVGEQPLYTVRCALLDTRGAVMDTSARRVGFRRVEWRPCEGAPKEADPWLCVVNGQPIFLQGVNFPPVRPNFADVTEADYRKRLQLYHDLGMNVLRINACGFLEKETFYDLCDELGLFVWQEFPLTSSGVENIPPADEESVRALCDIARSFIVRRQHHASLLLWSGGNELIDLRWRPLDTGHPMLHALQQVVAAEDPGRRFLPTSPSGPRFGADAKEFGRGLHWDVHGPWKTEGSPEDCAEYYRNDDALFRSEVGAPSAAPAALIRAYAGDCELLPISADNPLWRYPVAWWLEEKRFAAEHGRPPASAEEYVAWSQERQAQLLTIAVGACKARFPRCGGVILWCGHDSFPCPTNTSIVDFHGEPKPAALALAKVYRTTT